MKAEKAEIVSTHSRPKAAEIAENTIEAEAVVSTHSRPKAAAELRDGEFTVVGFQHTAARRRLFETS